MKKRLSSIFLIFVITLYSLTMAVTAAGTLNLSTSSAEPGDTVTASGIFAPDTWVAVKVMDVDDNILFYDNVKSDATGAYSCTFKIPSVAKGRLKVIAGYGSNVTSASLNIAQQQSDGNGGGRTSTGTSKPEKPIIKTTISGNIATATISTAATTDSGGNSTAVITQAQISDAINKAVAGAAAQGIGVASAVEIKISAPANVKTIGTSIPKTAVSEIANSNTVGLTLSTPIASIVFDKNALYTISQAASGDVKIEASKVDTSTLTEETRQIAGDRPVFNFSVISGNRTISQFGGNVSVAVPYTPKEGEDTSAIVIYYINAQGKPEIVSNCSYDSATGTIKFTTNHFSQYAVGYNKVSFKDVAADAWYSKAVSFVAARGITAGTGDGNYNPEGKLTRGQFITMVMRAYGMNPDENAKDNFADAGNTYYTGYLAAAKNKGITNGIGNNLFAPEKEITRQEMFTLLYNILKQLGKLTETATGETLTSYDDSNEIASWAKDAMTLFVGTGTISGSDGNLKPADTTNRAQIAQVLYNLLTR